MTAGSVSILNLGLGNLHSVAQAFVRAGAQVDLIDDADAVMRADRLVFPGQGSFAECAESLSGEIGMALKARIAAEKPYFGICLGLQALFELSEEAPGSPGLGVFKGRVKKFSDALKDKSGATLKVPHMGWNQIHSSHRLLEDGQWYYFVHSYHCVPSDPTIIAATTDYGGPVCAAVSEGNLFACQFHPEKSHRAGARVIERFLKGA